MQPLARVRSAGPTRGAFSLIEFLVVLGIIGVLIALILPAAQRARLRAEEMQCQNNVNQLNLGVAQYVETHKRLPPPGAPMRVGGWSFEVLPFVGQGALHVAGGSGTPIAIAPAALTRPPAVFRCPRREAQGEPLTGMYPAHYVLAPLSRRDAFLLYDAPLNLRAPWASGPELVPQDVSRLSGPHRGGFHCAQGFQQGVTFTPGVTDDPTGTGH